MTDEMWLIALLGTLAGWALVATVLWLRERHESREWQIVCACLGNEYDRLQLQCMHPPQSQVQEKRRWLN